MRRRASFAATAQGGEVRHATDREAWRQPKSYGRQSPFELGPDRGTRSIEVFRDLPTVPVPFHEQLNDLSIWLGQCFHALVHRLQEEFPVSQLARIGIRADRGEGA